MPRGTRKYPIPAHLSVLGISQEDFGKWLDKVTVAHIVRDRKRTTTPVIAEIYRSAIYRAVNEGGDRDYYTGEALDWRLLQHFSTDDITDREQHKVPSVDHEGVNTKAPVFRICSLRTNKCKSDCSVEQLFNFCQAFINYQTKLAQ